MLAHRAWLCKIGLHRWVRVAYGYQAHLECSCGKGIKYNSFEVRLACFLFGHIPDGGDGFMVPCKCCSRFV